MADVILITGYYRSGTSALSGALHRLGVTFHNDAEPNEHNPLGFYEIPELIEFDVELFARLGVEWTDLRGLADGWWERADMAPYQIRLEEILRRRFGAEALWGLKHPHLCRLLPLYERAVRAAGGTPCVIHICRDPFAVAASQQRKNGLSRAHALLLWLTYMVAAERQARHLPRAWVTYEDLLATPAAQIAGIARDLGIPLLDRAPNGLAAATEFLTGTLNRAVKVPETDLAPPLLALTETVWAAIQTRDSDPALWDGFAAQVAMFVGLLAEFGASRGPIVPGLIAAPPAALTAEPEKTSLRPAERLDEGARRRLLARAATGKLPRFGVIIAAPPRRAHAITETLESLRQQWRDFDDIGIVSADPIAFPGITTIPAAADAGAVTARLCEALNAADNVDYVAVINAGDILAPDACLRFALTAAETDADLIYCDEIVPNDQGGWVRHKPGWDVTRLRQSAYLGDWVCYRAAALRRLGGFDAAFAGAEEYDVQLRFAETGAQVVRLPEALFTRAVLSRRDNIPATEFGPRALAALAAHLSRAGIPGTARPRNYLGLFRHDHDAPDPGTATILLCDHAGIADLDRWMQALLGAGPTSGRIILAGANLTPPTYAYLAQVAAQAETLGALVAAVPPSPGLIPAAALRAALALADTEHVIILDAASAPPAPGWADALRARLADPCVAVVGARALIPLAQDPNRLVVQGPIIPGADIRLGAGHFADDPGPGGWLAVDAQASAVAPALLARRTAFAACTIPDLSGDALWIDLCTRIRAAGGRIVWTPDVSFIVPAAAIQPDPDCRFRAGAHAAHAVPAADPYHHPALSLHGNLLGPEPRLGLIRATPADPDDVLLSGPAAAGMAVLNAARALRGAGLIEASWAPEPFLPAELARRAPAAWVRINPDSPAASPYTAVFTTAPSAPALPAITAAKRLVATSPALAASLRKLAPARHPTLWRPALSGPLWTTLRPASGLNTKPRVLWIDEGIAPAWLPDLINDTRAIAAWIVVERPGVQYSGDIARLRAPDDEQGWARELGALAPHILLRPADVDAAADHYTLLLGAAAGCHALVDDRLDAPPSLGATALPNRLDAWRDALTQAITDFAGTYDRGRRARLACLALPSVEAVPPPWAERPMTMATLVARSAAD